MKLHVYAGIILMLSATCARAVQYEWPYADNLTVTILSSTSAEYHLHITTAMIDDPTIGAKESLGDVAQKKGIDGTGNFIFGGYHRHNQTAGRPPTATPVGNKGLQRSVWFTSVAKELSATFRGTTMIVNHSGSANGSECVGSTLWPESADKQNLNFDTWLSMTWNGGIEGSCLGVPPVNEWCALTTPVINFAYGNLTVADFEGASRTTTVGVECTTGMKYTLRLPTADQRIALNNGGTASVTANGSVLGKTLHGQAGENQVELTVTLNGPYERTGTFEGSGVLFVSYP
ncbi:hypothetical protein ACVW06_002308 [Pantoea ananatis]